MPREKLPATEDDEFYHVDLIGLPRRRGRQRDRAASSPCTISAPATSWKSTPRTAGDTKLLPFTDAVVPTVDLAARRAVIVLDEIEGDEPNSAEDDPCGAATSSRIFPTCFPATASKHQPRRQGVGRRYLGAGRHKIRGSDRRTAPSTTPRPAAAPAWF